MKLTARQVEPFLARPDPAVGAVLLYGPDSGLVRERAERLVRTVAADVSDPFQVSELTAAALREDPARLTDEAAALTFGGGRRVVRLRDCGDAVTALLKEYLASPAGALVLVEAGELGTKSSLRQLFEAAKGAVALPCYRDEVGDLRQLIAGELRAAGFAVAPDALAYLVEMLGSDRGVTRAEIGKLILYMGPAGPGARVELGDAVACVGDNAALSVDDLVFAVADGDLASLERTFETCLREGSSGVSLLRALAKHLLRLHVTRAAVGRGVPRDQAMRSLRPPVFYKLVPRFQRQLDRWTDNALAAALDRATAAERACKSRGASAVAEVLAHRALMQVAQQAARLAR